MHIWNTCRRSRARLESNWQEIIWASYFIRHAFIYAATRNLLTLEFFSLNRLCKKTFCFSIYNIVHTITSSNAMLKIMGVICMCAIQFRVWFEAAAGIIFEAHMAKSSDSTIYTHKSPTICNSEQRPKERSPRAQTLFYLPWNWSDSKLHRGTWIKNLNSVQCRLKDHNKGDSKGLISEKDWTRAVFNMISFLFVCHYNHPPVATP